MLKKKGWHLLCGFEGFEEVEERLGVVNEDGDVVGVNRANTRTG